MSVWIVCCIWWSHPTEESGLSTSHYEPDLTLQAGLVSRDNPDQLIIALEPEAASIYCRKLRLHQMIDLCSKTAVNGYSPTESVGAGMVQGKPRPLPELTVHTAHQSQLLWSSNPHPS